MMESFIESSNFQQRLAFVPSVILSSKKPHFRVNIPQIKLRLIFLSSDANTIRDRERSVENRPADLPPLGILSLTRPFTDY